jgi:membrane protein DedA with SNARE-associated domain
MTLHSLIALLLQHGEIALFFFLMLGIVGLPIPDETLLIISGFLLSKGKLMPVYLFAAAYLGAISGISVSYGIGRSAGSFLVKKYGKWIGLTEKRLEKTRAWFSSMGAWALFIGFFIPGVRHLTGYFAGTLELRFSKFALFAYTGGIFWSTLFILGGYFFGYHIASFI